MARFRLTAEHVTTANLKAAVAWCKAQGIEVVRARMDPTFTNQAIITVEGPTRRVATRLQNHIWDEINFGAFCEVEKVQ